MRMSVPYLRWRDGRPRFEPGPGLRAAGACGRDLKDEAGNWMSFEAAAAACERLANETRGGRQIAPAARNCLAQVWAAFTATPEFRSLAATTRRDYLVKAGVFLAVFGDVPVTAIRRRQVKEFWRQLHGTRGHAMANGVVAVLRLAMSAAVDDELIAANPLNRLKLPVPKSRERVLADAELRAIWRALPAARIGAAARDVLRLLMLTGQRSGEVASMVAAEIDIDRGLWTLPAARAKNGAEHIVPLPAPALRIVAAAIADTEDPAAPLFARPRGGALDSNAIAWRVHGCLQVLGERWTAHDLRRTVATGMAGLGIEPHVGEMVLNHVGAARAGVAGIYNRHRYVAEKRRALEVWARHLAGIIEAEPAKAAQAPETTGYPTALAG